MMTDQEREKEREDLKERIIGILRENPRINTRDSAHRTGASRSEVWHVLLNEGLHTYRLLKVQHLLPEDYGHREEFS